MEVYSNPQTGPLPGPPGSYLSRLSAHNFHQIKELSLLFQHTSTVECRSCVVYAQDNNSLPVWIILSPAHHHISINSQPFLVGIVSNLLSCDTFLKMGICCVFVFVFWNICYVEYCMLEDCSTTYEMCEYMCKVHVWLKSHRKTSYRDGVIDNTILTNKKLDSWNSANQRISLCCMCCRSYHDKQPQNCIG